MKKSKFSIFVKMNSENIIIIFPLPPSLAMTYDALKIIDFHFFLQKSSKKKEEEEAKKLISIFNFKMAIFVVPVNGL